MFRLIWMRYYDQEWQNKKTNKQLMIYYFRIYILLVFKIPFLSLSD
jgi:hypothetical protein